MSRRHPSKSTISLTNQLLLVSQFYKDAGCSFSAPSRGLTLIAGASGTGKTSLLTVIAGLAEPTSGSVRIGGYDDEEHMPAGMRLRLAGLVFQFPERHFLGETVGEELTFGWPRGFREQMARMNRLEQALNATNLSHLNLTTSVDALSGGYKRRLALAVQLARSPHVLLLDEPLAGLDFLARISVAELLGELSREQTVIVVTHDLDEMKQLSSHLWQMRKGGHVEPVNVVSA